MQCDDIKPTLVKAYLDQPLLMIQRWCVLDFKLRRMFLGLEQDVGCRGRSQLTKMLANLKPNLKKFIFVIISEMISLACGNRNIKMSASNLKITVFIVLQVMF